MLADINEQRVRIGGAEKAVLPGMGGRAAVIPWRRSHLSYAFTPLRQMREAMASGWPAR